MTCPLLPSTFAEAGWTRSSGRWDTSAPGEVKASSPGPTRRHPASSSASALHPGASADLDAALQRCNRRWEAARERHTHSTRSPTLVRSGNTDHKREQSQTDEVQAGVRWSGRVPCVERQTDEHGLDAKDCIEAAHSGWRSRFRVFCERKVEGIHRAVEPKLSPSQIRPVQLLRRRKRDGKQCGDQNARHRPEQCAGDSRR